VPLTPLAAQLYALTHRGQRGDVEFYAHLCRAASSVLELGAGFGRLLPALSRSCMQVVGLELDRHFLAAAERRMRELPRSQRRVRLLRGDMRRFELGQRFERIILPYNALYCLLTRRDILACLKSVRAHLAPGGRFAFDVWSAERFHREASGRGYFDDREPILHVRHREQTWDVFERTRLRRRAQRLDATYTYVSRERGTRVVLEIQQRYSLAEELEELLELAGLRIHTRFGTFAGTRFRRGSPHLIVLAGRL